MDSLKILAQPVDDRHSGAMRLAGVTLADVDALYSLLDTFDSRPVVLDELRPVADTWQTARVITLYGMSAAQMDSVKNAFNVTE